MGRFVCPCLSSRAREQTVNICGTDRVFYADDSFFEQPYVTEIDLRHSLIPDELIEELVKTMPQHRGPDLQEDRDLPKYDYVTFMDKITGGHMSGSSSEDSGSSGTGGSKINGR